MQRTRRAQLLWRATSLVIIMTLTAFMAPYVAQQTLQVAGWFTEGLPATGTALLSPSDALPAESASRGSPEISDRYAEAFQF
jgi:hypothetical protein